MNHSNNNLFIFKMTTFFSLNFQDLPRCNLPQHKRTRIHVYPQERIFRKVNRTIQDLRGHISSRANLSMCISTAPSRYEDQGQAKVSNASAHVRLEEYVLGFEVTVGYCRFSTAFLVKMRQASRHADGYAPRLGPSERVSF